MSNLVSVLILSSINYVKVGKEFGKSLVLGGRDRRIMFSTAAADEPAIKK